VELVELSAVDLCLEHTRHKDSDAERRLLSSIMERDIVEPLQVSVGSQSQSYVLLDGFKRYRCARKLEKGIIPVECIAEDVAGGVVALLRRKAGGALSVMEQAALIQELHDRHALSIYDIALRLERSPAWVSVRLGLIGDLSDLVRGKIMSGTFPARAYLYGIKGFTRVNNVSRQRIDAFVAAVSGKGLSARKLCVLSRAYFTGGSAVERLIIEGDAHRVLRMLSATPEADGDMMLEKRQQRFVKELRATSRSINRIVGSVGDVARGAPSCMQYVNLWCAAIQRHLPEFTKVIKELYDRSGPSECGDDLVPTGRKPQGDSATVTHGCKDPASDTGRCAGEESAP
jgi:hypothetical protein